MAAQFHHYGGPDVLEIETVARPTPASDQVLVQVDASTVNPHDAIVRSGALKMITGRKFPLGVGLDFAGTVSGTGTDVQGMSAGTKVWGMVSPKGGHVTGAAAQYVIVPADRLAAMPEHLSMTDGASLVTSGTTVLRALRDIAHLKADERVLVRGAAGGVGMTAVQLARALGAHVTALASQGDLEFVAGLGAHETLDYRAVTPRELERFNVILDTTGTELLAFRRRLARDGRMVTIAFSSGKAIATIAASSVFGAKRVRAFSSYPDRGLLDDLTGYIQSGAVWPIVDTVYPLQRIADAHRALTDSGHHGKLVVTTATGA